MSKILKLIYAFIVFFGTPIVAEAQSTRLGGLTCDASSRGRLVLGSRENLRCVFRSSDAKRRFNYSGITRGLDFDLHAARGETLFWAVFAPTTKFSRRTLRGNYMAIGRSPDPSGNVLIGGSLGTISLNPSTVEGQVDVNLSLAVTNLSLR